MSIFNKLFNSEVSKTIDSVTGLINKVVTTDSEKTLLKNELTELVNKSLIRVIELQADVLKTEMSGNWLQRSWRPILMLTFGALLVIRWTGLSSYQIAPELELELMNIIKIGLGGYVIGRSVEKTAETVTKNIDLPFLRKKDRNLK